MSPPVILDIAVIFLFLSLFAFGTTRQHPTAWTRPLRWGVIAPTLLWWGFAAWEWMLQIFFPQMYMRFDRLFIYPIVGLASLWAIISFSLILDRALRTNQSEDRV